MGERTLRRWKQNPAFRDAYCTAGRERLTEAVSRLRAATDEAVETLRAALSDESVPNRIRAASILLEQGLKVEVDDLAGRVAALEVAQNRGRP